LSSSSSSLIPLAQPQDHGVSGSKLTSDLPSRGPSTPTTPALSTSPPFSNIGPVNASSQPSSPSQQQYDYEATYLQQRPLSRRRNLITVHSDKTFSLQPLSGRGSGSGSGSGGARSPPVSSPTASSHEHLSSDALSDDRPSSPLTTLPDRSLSPYTPGSSSTQLAEDLITSTSSPWNYRMVGGLRKVPKTPDLKQKRALYSASPSDPPLATLPEAPITDPTSPSLAAKASFQSSQSTSTTSENTNYKVYGSSSPALPDAISLAPSSTDSNYQLLGESSSPAPSYDPRRPLTAESDENYVVHGDPSPSSSLVTAKQRLRPQYSQESLIVQPLKPSKKPSYERFGYFKQRSRESLRAGSLTSISSILSQEAAQAFFSSSASVYLQGGPSGFPGRRQDSWANSSSVVPTRSHMNTHPHQWSSQLSTVVSESEGGSDIGARSVSSLSGPGRRSSGFVSQHSRQMLSISSSLAAAEDRSHSRTHSRTDSVETPGPSYPRPVHRDVTPGSVRLIRDQDEHGDGLTDLQELQSRPSRTRLSGFFSSMSSERNLHSSASSRANSFNSSSLPTWARYVDNPLSFLRLLSDKTY
jgi:hypothetical protein